MATALFGNSRRRRRCGRPRDGECEPAALWRAFPAVLAICSAGSMVSRIADEPGEGVMGDEEAEGILENISVFYISSIRTLLAAGYDDKASRLLKQIIITSLGFMTPESRPVLLTDILQIFKEIGLTPFEDQFDFIDFVAEMAKGKDDDE